MLQPTLYAIRVRGTAKDLLIAAASNYADVSDFSDEARRQFIADIEAQIVVYEQSTGN